MEMDEVDEKKRNLVLEYRKEVKGGGQNHILVFFVFSNTCFV
jgi:hypothetical protein